MKTKTLNGLKFIIPVFAVIFIVICILSFFGNTYADYLLPRSAIALVLLNILQEIIVLRSSKETI